MTKIGKSYPVFVIQSKPEPKQNIWEKLPYISIRFLYIFQISKSILSCFIHICVLCIISLDRDKIRLLFDVLRISVALIYPKISSFYQCSRTPLVSILITKCLRM